MADGSRFDDRSGMGFTITLPLLVRQRARHDDRIAFMHASQHIARQRTERLDRNPYGRAIPPFLCGVVEIAASTPDPERTGGHILAEIDRVGTGVSIDGYQTLLHHCFPPHDCESMTAICGLQPRRGHVLPHNWRLERGEKPVVLQDVTVASAVLFILPDGMGTAPANRKMWSKDVFN